MATRDTYDGDSPSVPWADPDGSTEGFGNQQARHIKTLYDGSFLPLTNVGGTANAVTADVEPEIPSSGWVDGMKLSITWALTNTGGMNLTVGDDEFEVLSKDGAALTSGVAQAGSRDHLEFIGGTFRLMAAGGDGGTQFSTEVFTASGTFVKPTGLSPDRTVVVEGWGAGGGGSQRGGGGGGAYFRRMFRLGDLPASIAVGIGAGGAGVSAGNATDGGATTFGALMSIPGGKGSLSDHQGGDGGGINGIGGGAKGVGGAGGDATAECGGGGGAGDDFQADGGNAIGGGGGGASTSAQGGQSVLGGDGGDGGSAGQVPGGGGGSASTGARGELIVRIL